MGHYRKIKNVGAIDIFGVLGLTGIALIHLGPESGEAFKSALPFWNLVLNPALLFFFATGAFSIKVISDNSQQVFQSLKTLLIFYIYYAMLIVVNLIIGNRFIWANPLPIKSLINQLLFQSDEIFTNDYVLKRVLIISLFLFLIRCMKKFSKLSPIIFLFCINTPVAVIFFIPNQFINSWIFGNVATAVFFYTLQESHLYKASRGKYLFNILLSITILVCTFGSSPTFRAFTLVILLSFVTLVMVLDSNSKMLAGSNISIYTMFSFYVLNYNLGATIKNLIHSRFSFIDGFGNVSLSIIIVWICSLTFGYLFNLLVFMISKIPTQIRKFNV